MTAGRPDPNRSVAPCRCRCRCVCRRLAESCGRAVRRAWRRRLARPVADAGMATAEYAIATLAACGFAGLLVTLMRSDEVRTLLYDVIRRALSLN